MRRTVAFATALCIIWCALIAARIVGTARASLTPVTPSHDAAIILGAAVYTDRPSPVFAARLEHGVALYRAGKVRALILTGGRADGDRLAEADVGFAYAVQRGVPERALFTDTLSRTTQQNLVEARRIMDMQKLRSAIIVSDPLHLYRAGQMAEDLDMDVILSGTPTTRYLSWSAKAAFLARETAFTNLYWLSGN